MGKCGIKMQISVIKKVTKNRVYDTNLKTFASLKNILKTTAIKHFPMHVVVVSFNRK